jgi:nitronate monooxygenase
VFYGWPDAEVVDAIHRGGAHAGWQVGSLDEARAAAACGCDVIVAQGVEAGGHVRGTASLWELLPDVRALVDVPVVAAGGIGDAAAVRRAMQAGADAVRVGTRFVAAVEADAHPYYVQALVAADADDTTVTTCFREGWPDAPHRVLRSCIDAAERFAGDVVAHMRTLDMSFDVPRFGSAPPSRSATGAVEAMALYAGRSVGHVHGAQQAAQIVLELAAGLRGRSP